MFSTENLKPGDKVIVVCFRSFTRGRKEYVGEVTKKTPTGLVDVSYGNMNTRFKSNGLEYGIGEFYTTSSIRLEEWTEERGHEIVLENNRQDMIMFLSGIDFSKWGYLELYNVSKFIKDNGWDKAEGK